MNGLFFAYYILDILNIWCEQFPNLKVEYRMKIKVSILSLAIFLSLSTFVNATLFDRGNGMFYDDMLDVTWLDEFIYKDWGEVGDAQFLINSINTTGQGTSNGYMSSGTNTTYFEVTNRGFTDWRLPTIMEYNILGKELANDSFSPFVNLDKWSYNPNVNQHYWNYWSSDFTIFQNQWTVQYHYFCYDFTSDKISLLNPISYNAGAIAVRSGDVTPVPEPGTMLLIGTGLVGLAGTRFRKKK